MRILREHVEIPPLVYFISQVPGVNYGSAGKEETNGAHKFRQMGHEKGQNGYGKEGY